jgi:hypothetical protein
LRSAAVQGCLSEDSRVSLPNWLTSGFTADASTNPRGLPTASYRPLRQSEIDHTQAEAMNQAKAADPSVLLRHYIQYVMLEEGCELVRNLLIGSAGLATATVGEEVDHTSFGSGHRGSRGISIINNKVFILLFMCEMCVRIINISFFKSH